MKYEKAIQIVKLENGKYGVKNLYSNFSSKMVSFGLTLEQAEKEVVWREKTLNRVYGTVLFIPEYKK